MNVLLYTGSPSNNSQEVQRQWKALCCALASEDPIASSYYDLSPSGLARRPGQALALTLLCAGAVEEVHALGLDRLARTRPKVEELQEFMDRHGLVLKLVDEDSRDQREGGR